MSLKRNDLMHNKVGVILPSIPSVPPSSLIRLTYDIIKSWSRANCPLIVSHAISLTLIATDRHCHLRLVDLVVNVQLSVRSITESLTTPATFPDTILMTLQHTMNSYLILDVTTQYNKHLFNTLVALQHTMNTYLILNGTTTYNEHLLNT